MKVDFRISKASCGQVPALTSAFHTVKSPSHPRFTCGGEGPGKRTAALELGSSGPGRGPILC